MSTYDLYTTRGSFILSWCADPVADGEELWSAVDVEGSGSGGAAPLVGKEVFLQSHGIVGFILKNMSGSSSWSLSNPRQSSGNQCEF